jgi:hypothetical protein
VTDALTIVPMIVTQIELWKIERLIALARNPRTHLARADRRDPPRAMRPVRIPVADHG